ncbi:MAG: hypothetical protein ACFB2W_27305 [Leptolyngbyaceae cyanobacterium]
MSLRLFYPLPKVVCCQAKAYLSVLQQEHRLASKWDEALFTELSATLLQPSVQPLLTSACQSRDEAALVERQLVQHLVNTYRSILQQRQTLQIQRLNALL